MRSLRGESGTRRLGMKGKAAMVTDSGGAAA